jgi:hypothetical protein
MASVKKEMELSPLKLCTKASASYGSQPYQAFDGDPETGWSAGGPGPAWIQRDMGQVVSVRAIRTLFGNEYTHVTYQIDASRDGKIWTPLILRKTSNGGRSEDHPAATTAVRFVRTTIFSASSKERQRDWLLLMEQRIETE